MYFDSHAHYDDAAFEDDRDILLKTMHKNGIYRIINVGADMSSSLESVRLAEKYDFIYAAVGVHPHDVNNLTENDVKLLQKYCSCFKVVAIGETGLDYHYDDTDKEMQKYWFSRQLELCKKLEMPVIIHSRDAAADTLDAVIKSGVRKGVVHAFSASAEIAKAYIDMGFYIGVGGVVTFKNAKKLVGVVEKIPLERILLETDAPYLSPEPYRGKRNNSQNLQYVAAKIGEIKQISTETVIKSTCQNAEMLFFTK